MDKQIIRLTESDLHNIVRKSVNRILKEGDEESDKEWKSPLDKVRKNRDWKEINKNRIQVPNRPKKAKPTTLGDLPQFEKLKNLNVENYIHNIVKETVNRILREGIDPWEDAVYKHHTRERLPKGWERIDRKDDEPIYRDPDFNEYVKDEYGHFRRIENDFDF